MDRITLPGAANLPDVGPLELRAAGSGRPERRPERRAATYVRRAARTAARSC
ncbi:hypothetical protein [Streptomyces sp. CG 926]|uniref:hypothetical protein n=1 Tax=Streptomyces sp. CG 926 TaxID=1882405 RepID=UPI0015E7FC8F|nr:hypothetical protein [Streptomyces sp. CG 926]